MPTLKLAVLIPSRLRFSLSALAATRNAKRSNRAAFLRNLSLLLMSAFFASLPLLVGCALSPKPKLPEVVGDAPDFEELKTAVNANSAKIETIFSSDASIGVKSTPGWAKCQIAFERPGNLRVVGSAPTMGRVVDVGCNDERFWFWSDFQNSDELYFCRLDQYQNSAAARALPLDPTWFPEAFGVVELKDDELVDGPISQADGSLLVTLKKTRPDGVYLKRIYFEPKTAAILRQDVQAPSGETVLSIRCNRSVYLDSPGVVLPQKLEIECPRSDGALIVDVGTPVVNDSSKIVEKAFQQPTDLKAKAIDLGAATAPSAAVSTAANVPQAASLSPASGTDVNVSNDNNGVNVAAPASTVPNAATTATFEPTQPQIRMIARARVDAVPQNELLASQTLAAAPTVATAQTLQPAPTAQFSTPDVQQIAPVYQNPQIQQNAQNAPATQNAPVYQNPQIQQNAQNAPATQNAPVYQNPQIQQNAQNAPATQSAPVFQTPSSELLAAPSLDNFDAPPPEQSAQIPQSAPTLEDFDALLPSEAGSPPLPADFPVVDVPAPVGPKSEVVGAPRASF